VTAADRPRRREAELEHAEKSLRTEWRFWQAQAANGSLEKHTTQIDSIVGLLGAGLDEVRRDGTADADERVLDLHHVWDFFRVKLALRYVEPIRPFLDAADELAWAAYRPAVQAAGRFGVTLREPPLVFLDRGAVPFAATRGSSYRDLLPRDVRTRAGASAAAGLPFPVIGVPWYLSSHLPGVLLVAHEVGHHIEDDCELTGELTARLAAAGLPGHRLAVWTPWLGEVFADVVACVACGSAYVAVLVDSLAAGSADGAGAERYPPPRIRARLCLAAVRLADLPDGDALRADGDRLGAAGEADAEAAAVAEALLRQPYEGLGGRTLRDVLRHTDTARVRAGTAGLLAGLGSGLSEVRAVLPAAALAFLDDPATYDRLEVGRRAIHEVLELLPKGPRGLALGDESARAERDAAAARALLGLLN
jgi:hypothetical protein